MIIWVSRESGGVKLASQRVPRPLLGDNMVQYIAVKTEQRLYRYKNKLYAYIRLSVDDDKFYFQFILVIE